jgi:nucleoside-diphosphate-sugar epimerase
MKEKYKIFITGGTGFLGSNIINKLLNQKKYDVHVLCRNSSKFVRINKKNLKKIKIYKLEHANLENIFIKNKFDAVIHCATNYGLRQQDISEIIQPNLILPMRLLDLCKNYNVKAFLNTDTILNKNISNYSLSKYHFTEWLKLFSKEFYCTNIKIEHFFGPKDDDTKFVIYIIKSFLNNSPSIQLTKGIQKRDFVYIDDVVSAINKILNYSLTKKGGFETFEIGSGKNISIKNIVLLIKKLCKNKITKTEFGKLNMRKNDALSVSLNLNKIYKLNWKPKYNLNSSLEKTIKYYKKNL